MSRITIFLTGGIILALSVGRSMASTPNLRFASPLQSLTIWDDDSAASSSKNTSPRSQFLPRYKAGLKAEAEVRKAMQAKHAAALARLDENDRNWARKAAALEQRLQREADRKAEQAFEQASREYAAEHGSSSSSATTTSDKDGNSYQFVGVVSPSSTKAVTWYARKKPPQSEWSLRLVHVNRAAIIKDMFNRGKVDIFSRYKNTGKVDEETEQRIVKSEYVVKEKSWRTLWNFSPKHFFTDSSGMYWRERRLPPGTYTDGSTVYESSYRYRDGRNGMRRVSSFDQFLNSKKVDSATKEKVVKRMKTDVPDVVLEDK